MDSWTRHRFNGLDVEHGGCPESKQQIRLCLDPKDLNVAIMQRMILHLYMYSLGVTYMLVSDT